jgi:hypothetical protein
MPVTEEPVDALPDAIRRWNIEIEFGKALDIDYCIASGGGPSGVEITMPGRGWVNIYNSYDRAIWSQRQLDFT